MKYKIIKIIEKITTTFHLDKILWRFLPPGLYVFNFHRIGSKNESEFARDVFSCSEVAFEKIILTIKGNFRIVSAKELANLIAENNQIVDRIALITFDDGYIDNYTVAYPILKRHDVTALFFLSTSLINSQRVAWWDEITFLLRQSIGCRVTLPDSSSTILLTEEHIENQIQLFIQNTKRQRRTNIPKILAELHQSLNEPVKRLEDAPSLFMSWDNVKTMLENNMEVGSHTVSHQILSSLKNEEQTYEIFESKIIIETELAQTVTAFAYPVGSKDCYNTVSKKLCEQAGYALAFNNQPGINKMIKDPFDLYRICVDSDNIHKFRFNVWMNS